VAVNAIADFQFRDLRAGFLDDARDIVTGNERQMRPELLRIFPRDNERVGRIHAARDHADEDFVLLWLGPWRVFILEYVRPAVLMRDDRFHRWLFRFRNRSVWKKRQCR